MTYFKLAVKSEMNCPMNVVSYAQIAFKKLIFQARPANAHAYLQQAYDCARAAAAPAPGFYGNWSF